MSKKANPKQDYFKEAHEAALALRQANDAHAKAIQAAIAMGNTSYAAEKAFRAAEKAFRALIDPCALFNDSQLLQMTNKWADDPPQPRKETPDA